MNAGNNLIKDLEALVDYWYNFVPDRDELDEIDDYIKAANVFRALELQKVIDKYKEK